MQLDVGVDGAGLARRLTDAFGVEAGLAHRLRDGDAAFVLAAEVFRGEEAGGGAALDHAKPEARPFFIGERHDLDGALRLDAALVHDL